MRAMVPEAVRPATAVVVPFAATPEIERFARGERAQLRREPGVSKVQRPLLLLVDDDAAVREALGQTLELAGLQPTLASSYIEAKDHIGPAFQGVVVTDLRMPGKDGFALLDLVQKADPDLPVILLTGEGDVPMAVEAMHVGAFDFLEKPPHAERILLTARNALRQAE